MPCGQPDRIFSQTELRRVAAGLLPQSVRDVTSRTGSLIDWCVMTQVLPLTTTPDGRAQILERLRKD